ncbi:protein-ADP-ribose hydrolase [Anaerotruncus rubiinfantis]|jgi:O-acetyl-ADP-ribose deacetylase (regulator of RNase III)|uniref:protein-ADP-ribose hydrolase n=1 Tax=Anaerotruncus rubiinfantis TaxID=1720200 RepID=UPI00189BEC65|nr:protein-ADP-ribose hydrolase [Anaerotruncus rubiinfantis]
MERLEQIEYCIRMLLRDLPQYAAWAEGFPPDEPSRRRLLRSLMNLRPAWPLRTDFLAAQDEILRAEREEKGVVDAAGLPVTCADPRLALWRGDITRLRADAIVNAANSALLGCFYPCHGCIDNAIHSAAGLQLRDACNRIMAAQGHEEPTGQAKLTEGYNLPAKYVLHTVGPVVCGKLTAKDCRLLAGCYRSCLELANENRLASVAFCCISTGEFHFPNEKAAQIAVETVRAFLDRTGSGMKVIFNVFKEVDYRIYRQLLGTGRPAAGTPR